MTQAYEPMGAPPVAQWVKTPVWGSNVFPSMMMNGSIGLTKREYFAAAALIGVTATFRPGDPERWEAELVQVVVRVADALIAELAK